MMPSSYQNRKREIRYLKQCVGELEAIAAELTKRLKKRGGKPFFLPAGIRSGDFLTPYDEDFISVLFYGD